MPDFEINKSTALKACNEFDSIASKLQSISEETRSIMGKMNYSISINLASTLQRSYICANIGACKSDMKKLSTTLNLAIRAYYNSDKNVANKKYTYNKTVKKTKSTLEKIGDAAKNFGKSVKKKAKDVKSKVTSFVKKSLDGVKNTASNILDKTKETYTVAKGKVVNTINYLKENYNDHGWVYKTVEYGKAVLKIGGGVVKVVGGIAAFVGSYGTSTPLTIASIVSGVNDILNGSTDIGNITTKDYKNVGNVNHLKELLTQGGGKLGDIIGGETGRKIGEGVGKAGYYTVEIAGMFGGFQNAKASYTQTDIKTIDTKKFTVKDFLNTEISWKGTPYEAYSTTRYSLSQLAKSYEGTLSKIQKLSAVKNVYSSGKDIVSKVVEGGSDILKIDSKTISTGIDNLKAMPKEILKDTFGITKESGYSVGDISSTYSGIADKLSSIKKSMKLLSDMDALVN